MEFVKKAMFLTELKRYALDVTMKSVKVDQTDDILIIFVFRPPKIGFIALYYTN